MERSTATSAGSTMSRSAPNPVVLGGTDLSRMNGLTDALFAIVLTLLVLELRLPRTGVDWCEQAFSRRR